MENGFAYELEGGGGVVNNPLNLALSPTGSAITLTCRLWLVACWERPQWNPFWNPFYM